MVDRRPKRLAEFCRKNDVAELRIFGSAARREDTETSDVDLLVRFKHPKSLFELVRIEFELAEILGRKVDLVTEAALSPYLRETVVKTAQPLYEEAG